MLGYVCYEISYFVFLIFKIFLTTITAQYFFFHIIFFFFFFRILVHTKVFLGHPTPYDIFIEIERVAFTSTKSIISNSQIVITEYMDKNRQSGECMTRVQTFRSRL